MEELKLFRNTEKLDIEIVDSENDPYALERSKRVAEHGRWFRSVSKEKPSPNVPYKVGIYIRYYNQTKYENYLDAHIIRYKAGMEQFPNWTLVDFYIDKGGVAPHMENAPEWSRLLKDCMNGVVDLIITQKVSNVSRDVNEITFCARMLAALRHPVGIYIDSEEIFTTASYYQKDLHDTFFLGGDGRLIDESPAGGLLHD